MKKIKIEQTANCRTLMIGSYIIKLNESEYQDLLKIFSEDKDINTNYQDFSEYDSLVAELHKYCIMNFAEYERTKLYKKADSKLKLFDLLVKTRKTAMATSVTQRQHIERLQNELNDMKKRHKSDVINAIASFLYEAGDDDLEQKFHYEKAEKYYKQKFESND